MAEEIVIVDYGMGNLNSVKRKLERLNTKAVASSDPAIIEQASKLILPGVGHFGKAMEKLHQQQLFDVLNHTVLEKNTPILGVCLGMQLMAKNSEEGNATGLGWFDADIVRFKVSDKLTHKVPHTGWNSISIEKESRLMEGVASGSDVYFVHSFHIVSHNDAEVLNRTTYDYSFVSAVEKNNIFGVQYHPEKSHDVGDRMFQNFIQL